MARPSEDIEYDDPSLKEEEPTHDESEIRLIDVVDEYIRHGATLESMPKLKPAFDKEGTVTAGNARV